MKQDDFERLKAICEKEGFEISTYRESDDNGTLIHIKPKDIWEGVEFAECVDIAFDTPELKMGRLYKITSIYRNYVQLIGFDFSFGKQLFKKSTEQAYVDHLKKEAFERYGEIKEGDSFVNTVGYNGSSPDFGLDNYHYHKSDDSFYIWGIFIYQQGKWATKLPKRIEVELIHETLSISPTYQFKVTNFNEVNNANKSGQFLTSQLEKYLNNEIQD